MIYDGNSTVPYLNSGVGGGGSPSQDPKGVKGLMFHILVNLGQALVRKLWFRV